jgi:hypothetical protein
LHLYFIYYNKLSFNFRGFFPDRDSADEMPLNESDDVDDVEDEDEDDEDVALLEAIRLSQMESMSDLDIRMREEEELKQVNILIYMIRS